jgi:NAD(P)-dependent dehydrogenase (short-subunit alcohol dehydrogenase family)
MNKGSVIVTGAAQGIGKITAKQLLESGYEVYVLDMFVILLLSTPRFFAMNN